MQRNREDDRHKDDNLSPLIYDAYGVPNTTKTNKQRTKQRSLKNTLPPRTAVMQAIRRFWAWILACATVVALAISVYELRPILTSSSSLLLDAHDPYSVQFAITDNGHIPITGVEADCEENKVEFAHGHTVKLINSRLMDIYSIIKVDPGETFTVMCPEQWHLFLTRDGRRGVITYSDTPIVMNFIVSPNGQPVWDITQNVFPIDIMTFVQYQATAIDLDVVIRYHIPVFPWSRSKRLRFITREMENHSLIFAPMPDNQPIIPDGNGLLFTMSGLVARRRPR